MIINKLRLNSNHTSYKRWSCYGDYKLLCKLCRNFLPQQWVSDFLAGLPCGPAGWLALLLIKAGDVETTPGPTTTLKGIWICDNGNKQIHGMKQISIRCKMIDHGDHLRCAGIRLAEYTDTCQLHKSSRLTTHTDITPPHSSRPFPSRLPIPHLHHPYHRNSNTDTC